MKAFEALADRVEARLHEASLEEAALAVLEETPAHTLGSIDEILEWLAGTETLPAQEDLGASFGQPPITVARREGFHVQLLVWRDGTTEIHQHAFSGAFGLVHGRSAHIRYEFDASTSVSEDFGLGELRHAHTEFLSAGDCRRIPAGSALIHSVFHLDHPTLSVVIRDGGDAEAKQFNYGPTLRYEPFERSELVTRKLQLLDLLVETHGVEEVDEKVALMLASVDMHGGYLLLEHLARRRGSLSAIGAVVAAARVRWGSDVDALCVAVDDRLRIDTIVERRTLTRSASERALLALLMSVPHREGVLDLFGRFTGSDDAPAAIASTLRTFAARPCDPRFGANALGIDIDNLGFEFLEHRLRENSEEAALARCSDPGGAQLWALMLPRSRLLAPLFR